MSQYGTLTTEGDAEADEDDSMLHAPHNPTASGRALTLARHTWADDKDADSDKRRLVAGSNTSDVDGDGGSRDCLAGGVVAACALKRVHLAVLGFLMELVCYADRTNISLAIVEMENDLGWDNSIDGQVLAAFFVGYACTQVLGGWASERFGGKPVLLWAVLAWSAFTLLTPPAAHTSLGALLATRALMGLGEGVSLPAMHHLAAIWVPAAERSRFITLCTSGQFAGTVAAMACSPMVAADWASIFFLWGAIGVVWVALWWLLGASTPELHPSITRAELRHIRCCTAAAPAGSSVGAAAKAGAGMAAKAGAGVLDAAA